MGITALVDCSPPPFPKVARLTIISVRDCLLSDPKVSTLTTLPIKVLGAVRHFTSEEGVEPRSLDPLLFMGLQPKTSNFFWYSVQEVFPESDGKQSFDALVLISWPFKDPEKDEIPEGNALRVANMKARAKDFHDPIRRLFDGIPDDSSRITALTLADFPPAECDGLGLVTLIGDAAHAMTMYRGEGANHGILDAALLVDQLVKVKNGEIKQEYGVFVYEEEMKKRCHEAVLKSRAAAVEGHTWEKIVDDSPLIGGRWPPATA